MLRSHAEFPQTGALAYVRPTGEEVRILQRMADGECLVGATQTYRRRDASNNRRLQMVELAATKEEAQDPATDPRPKRVQLSRRRGARMPENTVSVDAPSKWQRRFAELEMYRAWLKGWLTDCPPPPDIAQLRGKNLAAWEKLCRIHALGKPLGTECAHCEPSHADVLLELSNG